MRLTVARPYERHTPGYSPPESKAHAVAVAPDGTITGQTMCGLDVDGLRLVKAGFLAERLRRAAGRLERAGLIDSKLAAELVGRAAELRREAVGGNDEADEARVGA
jgi:hypothetical protein